VSATHRHSRSFSTCRAPDKARCKKKTTHQASDPHLRILVLAAL
jgi:hypothetical protein